MKRFVFATVFVLTAAPAVAAPPSLLIDCARPVLPDQQAVARLTGLDNPGQVYAARARLMAEAGRACHRDGAQQVRIVLAPQAERAQALAAAR